MRCTAVAQAELRNPESCAIRRMQLRNQSCAIRGVAQSELRNPESCAIRQMQLRKQSCAILRVAQSIECSCAITVARSGELRNPESCAILVAQSDQRVAQSELRNPVKFRNLTLFQAESIWFGALWGHCSEQASLCKALARTNVYSDQRLGHNKTVKVRDCTRYRLFTFYTNGFGLCGWDPE